MLSTLPEHFFFFFWLENNARMSENKVDCPLWPFPGVNLPFLSTTKMLIHFLPFTSKIPFAFGIASPHFL